MDSSINTFRDEDMWTPRRLAEVAEVTEAEVIREIEAGTLKASRAGDYDDEWTITEEEARRWLAEQGIETDEE